MFSMQNGAVTETSLDFKLSSQDRIFCRGFICHEKLPGKMVRKTGIQLKFHTVVV